MSQNEGMGIDLGRHRETCPVCGTGLDDEIKFRATTCPNPNCRQTVYPGRQTVIPPQIGQGNGVRVYEDTLPSRRDDIGFTHPNLHRRINLCECMAEWKCPLHKNIGPCNCRPTVECVCHLITDSNKTGIEYAMCSDWDIAEADGVVYAICVDCPGALTGVDCASCTEEFKLEGRPTSRKRPNEGYRVGINALNSRKTTDIHLHNEEQVTREVP